MKRLLIMLLLLFGFPTMAMAGPVLKMPVRFISFDQPVQAGAKAKVTFTLSNEGDSELIINKVVPNCGCVASYYDRSVSQNSDGRIEFLVNTRGMKGRVRKKALIQTNDPRAAKFIIEMEVNVLNNRNKYQ